LEKTIAHIESFTKERRYKIDLVALVLEMANTHYDSNNSSDSNIQLINSKMRLEEIASGCNELINEYLSVLQRKDFIRYYKEQGLHIPTDKGMNFLKIYNMLASLLI